MPVRRAAAAAVLLLALAAGRPARAIDRAAFGEAKARAVDAVIGSALPGAQIDWNGSTIMVTMPDGTKSSVDVKGFREVAKAQGPLYAMELELPELARAAAAPLRAFDTTARAPKYPPDILAAVQTSATGEVLAMKKGRLDPTAAFVDTREFELLEGTDPAWPGLKVTYWANYGSADWYGSVRWLALFDFATMANASRMPVGIDKTRKVGGRTQDQLAVARLSDSVVRIEGGVSETLIDYPCPFPCMFDGRSLLASW